MKVHQNYLINNKKRIASIIITLILIVSFTIQSFAYPISLSLNVAEMIQADDTWCWAASSCSILDYFGISVTQIEFVETVKGSIVFAGAPYWEVSSGLEHYGIQNSLYNSYLPFSTIITETYNYSRPIYAGLKWNYDDGGHAVVIDGYSDGSIDYVYYMDPWDGDHYGKTYTDFKGGINYSYTWSDGIYRMYK